MLNWSQDDFDLTHVLVPANTVTASDGATRTGAVSTGALAVIFPDVIVDTPALSAGMVAILTSRLRFRFGLTVIITSMVISSLVVSTIVSCVSNLQSRVAAVVVEMTVVVSSSELDVSIVTPVRSPGVLDQDVVRGVSNSSDGVVSMSGAGCVPEDTSGVGLELVGYLKCNGDGSLGNGSNVSCLSSSNRFISSNLSGDHGIRFRGCSAGTVTSSVTVISGRSQPATSAGRVIVGPGHPSSLTSVTTSSHLVDTVKVLLLGEVPQFSRDLLVPGLKSSNSSESPAGSTTSLVLDGCNSSFVGPQLAGRDTGQSTAKFGLFVGSDASTVESKVAVSLRRGHGREEVEGKLSCLSVHRVLISNQVGTVTENSESHPVLGGPEVEVLFSLEVAVELQGLDRGLEDSLQRRLLGQSNSEKS